MATTSGTKSVSRSYNFKVVMLGNCGVGKSSVVLRYVKDTFKEEPITTFEASFLSKKVNVRKKTVNLSLWDTAGQEKYGALVPVYYKLADGAILLYDVTDEDSFQKVKYWVKELKNVLDSDVCLTIAGNKVDLEEQRNVSDKDAEDYANSLGAKHFHISAKWNHAIEEMFYELSERMVELAEESSQQNASSVGQSGSTQSNVVVKDDEAVAQSKSGCCGGVSSAF